VLQIQTQSGLAWVLLAGGASRSANRRTSRSASYRTRPSANQTHPYGKYIDASGNVGAANAVSKRPDARSEKPECERGSSEVWNAGRAPYEQPEWAAGREVDGVPPAAPAAVPAAVPPAAPAAGWPIGRKPVRSLALRDSSPA